jgi:hypothetical protein
VSEDNRKVARQAGQLWMSVPFLGAVLQDLTKESALIKIGREQLQGLPVANLADQSASLRNHRFREPAVAAVSFAAS